LLGYISDQLKTYVDQEIDEEISINEDREASKIDTVVVVIVVVVAAAAAAADADDDYDNDDGEKEFNQFITYYFSSTCRFATDIHLLRYIA